MLPRASSASIRSPRGRWERLYAKARACSRLTNWRDGTRIWIITEVDPSVTTILLPEEY
jgi:hypothetical protein